MAQLTFSTPTGRYCAWDSAPCMAFKKFNGYCRFFGEFLHYDGTAYERCEACRALEKHGAALSLEYESKED